MIKHVVMWTIKDSHDGLCKTELANKLKTCLLNLQPLISQVKNIEVGINSLNNGKNYDVILISEFESASDLEIYAQHPEHLKVVEFVKQISTGRAAVDYNLN